ncbi:metallophosphoesterase [Marinicauda pacifica]|jgi:3',5'-cyclic AMP phosphodiesterase CpdA|uniref:Metallophosphoesterase n=1 Tax=Marinicauda pacifica TaxID=1133559 RepID=A0A4S2HEI2_9PROT|nr:metallophosphoesterase [Marinicauda pacifica]TGY94022.1 metallophosphoesterase [Marinicauda pacifica]GGE32183.1 metallophosphoesterase [Marinicauda pacifica]
MMTKILHIADLHFGREDERLVEALAEMEKTLAPDVVVASGDLTTFGKRSEFAAARKLFERFRAPVVASPGNHDVPYANIFSRLLSPWRRFRRRMGDTIEPRFADDKVAIESFETSRGAQWRLDWSLGRARPDQAREIAGRLQHNAPNGQLRVVTCHHPLVAPEGMTGRAKTKFGGAAADVFIRGGAHLVLTGHMHQVFALAESHEDHVCWFVSASTAFSIRTRDEPAGFNLLTVEDDHFVMDVYVATTEGDFMHSETRHLNRKESEIFPEHPGKPGI